MLYNNLSPYRNSTYKQQVQTTLWSSVTNLLYEMPFDKPARYVYIRWLKAKQELTKKNSKVVLTTKQECLKTVLKCFTKS